MKRLFFVPVFLFLVLDLNSANHNMAISGLVFSKDGKMLYSSSFDSSAIIWDISKAKSVKRFHDQRGFMTSIAISPYTGLLFTTARDKTIAVRRSDGRLVRKLRAHSDAVNCVKITKNFFISASDNGEVFVWNAFSYRIVKAFRFRVAGIDSLSISPDGKYVVAGCVDGKLRIISLKSFRLVKTIYAHGSYVYASAFLTNELFVSGSDSGRAYIWSLKDFKKKSVISNIASGVLSILKGKNSIFIGNKKGELLRFSPSGERLVKRYSLGATGISALAIKGNMIACGNEAGRIFIVDIESGSVVKSF